MSADVKDRGLGDTVARFTRATGIAWLAEQIAARRERQNSGANSEAKGDAPPARKGCGACKRRQEALNRAFPYGGQSPQPGVRYRTPEETRARMEAQQAAPVEAPAPSGRLTPTKLLSLLIRDPESLAEFGKGSGWANVPGSANAVFLCAALRAAGIHTPPTPSVAVLVTALHFGGALALPSGDTPAPGDLAVRTNAEGIPVRLAVVSEVQDERFAAVDERGAEWHGPGSVGYFLRLPGPSRR